MLFNIPQIVKKRYKFPSDTIYFSTVVNVFANVVKKCKNMKKVLKIYALFVLTNILIDIIITMLNCAVK